MKIFNWLSNKKDGQTSGGGKITAKQVLDFSKTYEELSHILPSLYISLNLYWVAKKKLNSK